MELGHKISVVAVVGPTASGKSNMAVKIAKRVHGEVVSADSMQIYKSLNIGTAKPTVDEMDGIPHHLIDFVELTERFSVADYVELANKCIAQIDQRGKIPVVTGGTGLYVRSLLQNITFTENDRDEVLRRELSLRAQTEGGQALLEELRIFDPQSAERIHPNNLPRIIRAIEIYRTTGLTMTQQNVLSHQMESTYNTCLIGLTYRNRQVLYDRINRRVDEMMENGLLEEAKFVLSHKNVNTAVQAIGYKELEPFLKDEITLEEAVNQIKQETRHYAKRQLTWFKRDNNIHWIYVDDYSCKTELLDSVLQLMKTDGIL